MHDHMIEAPANITYSRVSATKVSPSLGAHKRVLNQGGVKVRGEYYT
jgi:hypothetical protein